MANVRASTRTADVKVNITFNPTIDLTKAIQDKIGEIDIGNKIKVSNINALKKTIESGLNNINVKINTDFGSFTTIPKTVKELTGLKGLLEQSFKNSNIDKWATKESDAVKKVSQQYKEWARDQIVLERQGQKATEESIRKHVVAGETLLRNYSKLNKAETERQQHLKKTHQEASKISKEEKDRITELNKEAERAFRNTKDAKAREYSVQSKELAPYKSEVRGSYDKVIKTNLSGESAAVKKLISDYGKLQRTYALIDKSKVNLSKSALESLKMESAAVAEQAKKIKEVMDAQKDAKATEFRAQQKELSPHLSAVRSSYASVIKGNLDTESSDVKSLTADYNRLEQTIATVNNSKVVMSQKSMEQIKTESAAIVDRANKLKDSMDTTVASQKQIEVFKNQLISFRDSNTKISRGSAEGIQISSMLREASAESGILTSRLKTLQGEFAKLRGDAIRGGAVGKSTMDAISSAYQRFGGWALVTRSLSAAMRSVRDMVGNVKALDAAMTELKKVTDETDVTYERFFEQAAVRAKELGATVTDTITATADFARLGYNLQDASSIADAALIYKNVGDGIDNITDASESIVSTMKGFGMETEEAMFIVDKFNEVGNNFAISSKGVGEALMLSASALASANNTIDESIAIITAGNTVIQDPSKMGTAAKTVSMFLRAAKTEAEDAGISTDGMAQSVSKLRGEILALTGQKVDIQLDENTFKSTYQIFKELSAVWDQLSDISQANILERLGGKRNANVVAAIIKNFNIAENVMQKSINATGSAIKENEKYLDSIKGKIAKYKAAFEETSSAFLDASTVKNIVSGGASLLNIFTKMIKMTGPLSTLSATFVGIATTLKAIRGTEIGLFKTIGGQTVQQNDLIDRFRTSYDLSKLYSPGKMNAGQDVLRNLRAGFGELFDGTSGKIAKYNELIKTTTLPFEEVSIAAAGSNDALKAHFLTLEGGEATLNNYAASLEGSAEGMGKFGSEATRARIATAALNVAASVGMTLAVGMLVKMATAAFTARSEMKKATIEAGSAAVKSAKEVQDLNSEYIAMGHAVKNGTESRVDLMKAQDAVVGRLRQEGIYVEDLGENYQTLAEKIELGTNAYLKDAATKAAMGAQTQVGDAVSSMKSIFRSGGVPYKTLISDKDVQKFLQKEDYSFSDTRLSGSAYLSAPNVVARGTHLTYEQAIENQRYFEELAHKVTENFGINNKQAQELNSIAAAYKKSLDGTVDMVNQADQTLIMSLKNELEQSKGVPTDIKRLAEFRETLTELFTEDGRRLGLSTDAQGTVDSILGGDMKYSTMLAEITAGEKKSEELLSKKRYVVERLNESLFSQAENYKSLGTTLQDINQIIQSVSPEELSHLIQLIDTGMVSSWGQAKDALAAYNEEQQTALSEAQEISDSLQSMYNLEGFEKFRDQILQLQSGGGFSGSELIELISSSDDVFASKIKDIIDEFGVSADYMASVLTAMAKDGAAGLELISDEAIELSRILQGLQSEFGEVTEAKRKWDEALKTPAKDADFKFYSEVFGKLKEELEAGNINSNLFWDSAEILLGAEALEELGYSSDKVQQAITELNTVFSSDTGILEKLYELDQAGKLVDQFGNKLLTISKDDLGSITFGDIDPENLTLLAEKLGVTEAAALACFAALGNRGDVDFYDINELSKWIDDVGFSADRLGKKVINIDALEKALRNQGKNAKEIFEIKKQLEALGNVQFISLQEGLDGTLQTLKELKVVSQTEGGRFKVNVDELDKLKEELNLTSEELAAFYKELEQSGNVDFVGLDGKELQLDDILAKLSTLNEEQPTGIMDKIKQSVQEVNKLKLSGVSRETRRLSDEGNRAKRAFDRVYQALQKINNFKLNLSFGSFNTPKTSGLRSAINSSAHTMEPLASGTQSAKGGPALVGEEGYELVQSKDRAYLVGTAGAEVVKLNSGDVVYPHEETKAMLGVYKNKLFGTIPAFAKGTKSTYGKITGATIPLASPSSGSSSDTTKSKEVKEAKEVKEETQKLNEEVNKLLDKMEHSIFLLQKNKAEASKIVELYRQMQAAVAEQANTLRSQGIAEDSEEIRELQKKWWEYQDSIQSTITEGYEKQIDELESAINLADKLIKDAVDKRNLNVAEAHADSIIGAYKNMQKIIMEQVSYFKNEGYAETSKEITGLKSMWHDYENSMQEIKKRVVENIMDMVRESSKSIDDLQNVFDTFKSVAEEFSKGGGYISVDSFQKIVELGPQYMQYLRDEQGLLVINRDNINKIIAAKTEQLALDNALAYVERLRLAMQEGSIEQLNQLLFATTETTNATWGFVYASLSLLGLNDQQYNAALHNINSMRALSENAISGIHQMADETGKSIEDMRGGIDNILKYVMDMLKHRIGQQIDAIKEMKTKYGEIVNLRKESLRLAKEESKYQETVADKVKELSKLQAKITSLSLDDSREANAEKAKLEEDMAKLQKDLADTQSDYSINNQEKSLDKMKDAYDKQKDEEVRKLEQTISSQQKLYDMAIEYIQNHWDTLYGELINWNTEYGNSLNSEISTAWDNALAAAQKYGSYVAALEATRNTSQSTGGSGSMVVGNTKNYGDSASNNDYAHAMVREMYRNSNTWMTADDSERQRLSARNISLGTQLSQHGINAVRGDDGVWYVDRVGGERLFDKYREYTYHKGGVAGNNPTLKQNELMTILEKGEIILDKKKEDNLYKLLNMSGLMAGKLSEFLGVSLQLNKTYKTLAHDTGGGNSYKITFGDVYINGGDESTIKQHKEINRKFANDLLEHLKIKR